MGGETEHEYSSSCIHFFNSFHEWETIYVVCNGEKQILRELQVFLEVEEEGILSSTLSPSWAHSLAPVVFSKGPSVQSWPVLSHTGMMLEPERNLASDGAHEHVLRLLPVLPSVVKNQPGNTWDMVQSPRLGRSSGGGNGNPLQYSILQYSLPWTEEPGRVQSMGSQRVGFDLVTCKC